MWAFLNDAAQRLLTWNKREQRANLQRVVGRLGYAGGARVLDFGCGTGLFATTLARGGARYVGYDIDPRLVAYAGRLYPALTFTDDRRAVAAGGPYDCVLANCCFHHIPDAELGGALEFIKSNLDPSGYFVLIDILRPVADRSRLRQVSAWLERGDFVRRHEDYLRLLEPGFEIAGHELTRAHLLHERSPFYSDLGIYVCRPRPTERERPA
jgi:SAM-dependent methyltransferase